MSHPTPPRFRTLDREHCIEILARNHVGRIAYAWKNHVDIEPLHYVYHDGWLYGRTSHGAKIEATGTTWWPVAFEVDEVEDLFRWRSVVVHGGFYTVGDDGVEVHADDWRRGIELLRTLIPETFAEGDPVAFRTIVFRMAVQEVTGREAVPGDAPAAQAGSNPRGASS
jgi:nitroimidazol reductase NimA-like FMN-containing flavoprotein (pyridoxamine 5'-phosphate oxidase superfamily)